MLSTVNVKQVVLCRSPHLLEVRERIRINGQPLSRARFVSYFWDVYRKLDNSRHFHGDSMPSYFELLTVMAFSVFLENQVSIHCTANSTCTTPITLHTKYSIHLMQWYPHHLTQYRTTCIYTDKAQPPSLCTTSLNVTSIAPPHHSGLSFIAGHSCKCLHTYSTTMPTLSLYTHITSLNATSIAPHSHHHHHTHQ